MAGDPAPPTTRLTPRVYRVRKNPESVFGILRNTQLARFIVAGHKRYVRKEIVIFNRHNSVASCSLCTAFLVSLVGDWFFENQWSNPHCYIFEGIVWSAGFAGFFILYKFGANSGTSTSDIKAE